MSNPNINLGNLDSRYSKPADVLAAISAQATTDAGQYALLPRSSTHAVGQGELFINVKDYGATGNGSNDDATAVRAAIAAASSTGGIIFFPQGTYRIVMTSTLTNIALPAGITLKGVKGASILNIDSDASGAGVYRGFAFNNGADVTIESLTINRVADFGGNFIDSRAFDRFTLRDCIFNGSSTTYPVQGISFFHVSSSGSMDGMVWDNCKVLGWRYGFYQDNTSTLSITNTLINKCYFSGNAASDLEFNAPSGVMSNVIVTKCTFMNNLSTSSASGWGVGLAYISHVRITDNYFSGYYGEAVHIEDFSSDIIVSNNFFTFCAKSRANYLYVFTGANRIKVENNQFDGTLNTTAGQGFVNIFQASGSLILTATGATSIGSGVSVTISASPVNIPSGTAITFTGGGVFTTTAAAIIGATTLTGNLTTAAITNGNTATIYLTPSGHNGLTAPTNIIIAHNDFNMGTYINNAVFLSATKYAVVRGNTFNGSGFVVSGNWTNPSPGQLGIVAQGGSSTVIDANVMFGFNGGISGTASGNVLAFGHGSVVSNNSLTQCNIAIDARNAGATTINGNSIVNSVRPIIIGTGSTGSGTTAHPVTVSGNVAYGCTNPLDTYNAMTVTANGAASIGTGITLTVVNLLGLIKSGTVLTFSGGGVFTLTADAALSATSITGNLTIASIASTQTAIAMSAYSSTVADNIFVTNGNVDTVLGTSAYNVAPPVATRTVTTSTPVTLRDNNVYLNGSTLTATLPAAAISTGRVFTIKNINASSATVTATSGTIDGSTTDSLSQYAVGRYQSDGTNYYKL